MPFQKANKCLLIHPLPKETYFAPKTMRTRNLNFSLITFHLVIFSAFISNIIVKASSEQFLPDFFLGIGDPCANVSCAQGTCIASNANLLGFDCQCNPGWKKYQLGPFEFPPCNLPNCTLDFQCGNGAPEPPPPPPPPFNLTSPCGLVWCGDGTCVVNGTGYYCQCNDGSANLGNLTGLACFKQCFFGGDCNGVKFGQHSPPPPSSSAPPKNAKSPAAAPPPENTTANGTNSTKTAGPPSNDSGRMSMGLGLVVGLGLFCIG